MTDIETPFPVEGTITPKENGFSASLGGVASEWLTETEDGTDYLKAAVDRAARKYGEGTEVRVRFTSGPHGMGCGGYELLGEVESEPHELEGACVDCGQVEVLNDAGYCPFCVDQDGELVEEIVEFLEERADEEGLYTMFWSLDKAYDRFDGSLEERMKERGSR